MFIGSFNFLDCNGFEVSELQTGNYDDECINSKRFGTQLCKRVQSNKEKIV